MIRLTRLNSSEVIVNSDLIELIEATPDTVISLTTGEKIIVRERAEEIVERIIEYKRKIFSREAPTLKPRLVPEDRTPGDQQLRVISKE